MLSTHDIAIVKSTVPLIDAGGVAITDHFYNRLFSHNPELKNIFNMSNQHTGAQKVALFEAIAAYAKNLDNLSVLKHAVERIANKHTSFHIQPSHYDTVGHHLIETYRELLPEQFTESVEQAWKNAYGVLANIFVNREEELYSSRASKSGGWRGKRAFSLVEKIVESELVTSFVFEPIDQQPVMDFYPGQYLGVELNSTELEHTEIRQYSLSTKPNGKSYRISVKRESGIHQGVVSNYLHDHLEVSDLVDLHAPTGDFFLLNNEAPVVLISAGVGITPMQSMLDTLDQNNFSHPVTYIHACEFASQHSFKQHTEQVCNANQWKHYTWYNLGSVESKITNEQDQSAVFNGLIDFTAVDLPIDKGDFYLCGPVGFMKYAKQQLEKIGVAKDRIHYEVFGPQVEI